mmetsp:Transcript_7575/g.22371  ORF Transcript_7575/g.22371 Transcript_7575/m.22371 type:complete len:227 (+) Transcript_7575:381-1061(+)
MCLGIVVGLKCLGIVIAYVCFGRPHTGIPQAHKRGTCDPIGGLVFAVPDDNDTSEVGGVLFGVLVCGGRSHFLTKNLVDINRQSDRPYPCVGVRPALTRKPQGSTGMVPRSHQPRFSLVCLKGLDCLIAKAGGHHDGGAEVHHVLQGQCSLLVAWRKCGDAALIPAPAASHVVLQGILLHHHVLPPPRHPFPQAGGEEQVVDPFQRPPQAGQRHARQSHPHFNHLP